MAEFTEVYNKILYVSEDGTEQTRLTISEMNDREYFQIRKYYLDFSGDWFPTKTGICFPVTLSSMQELFSASAEIISLAESREVIESNFSELINSIYQR